MRKCALCASGLAQRPPLVAKTTMKFGFPQRQNVLWLTEQTWPSMKGTLQVITKYDFGNLLI